MNTFKKTMTLCVPVFIIMLCLNVFDCPFATAGVLHCGEELEYDVKYIGIKLGTIKVLTEEEVSISGRKTVKTRMIVKSAVGIPFVSINMISISWIDYTMTFSHRLVTKNEDKGCWDYNRIDFDYANEQIKIEKWKHKNLDTNWIINSDKKWNDGLSLFFLAREYASLGRCVNIPTVLDFDTTFSKLNFLDRKEEIETDAVDYPVRTIYLNGKLDDTGVYGLSGYFEGWFSDDEARIPLLAKLNVYLGTVTMELVRWKRKGWMPPGSTYVNLSD